MRERVFMCVCVGGWVQECMFMFVLVCAWVCVHVSVCVWVQECGRAVKAFEISRVAEYAMHKSVRDLLNVWNHSSDEVHFSLHHLGL